MGEKRQQSRARSAEGLFVQCKEAPPLINTFLGEKNVCKAGVCEQHIYLTLNATVSDSVNRHLPLRNGIVIARPENYSSGKLQRLKIQPVT